MKSELKAGPGSRLAGQWTAILLAGQRPSGDELAQACGQDYKALIPIHGQTMLRRVTDALLGSAHIGKIIILAQAPEALAQGDMASLSGDERIVFDRSNAGIAMSIVSVAGSEKAPWPVLVTTADNVLLTPEIIDTFLAGIGDSDVAIGMVERQTMLAAYPDSQRTWLKFKGGAYSGANLFALSTDKAKAALTLWSTVEQDRKKVRKIFAQFGPVLMVRALTRTITFDAALNQAGKRLSLRAKHVSLPFAEAAIDVDKLSDLDLVTKILDQDLPAGHKAAKP